MLSTGQDPEMGLIYSLPPEENKLTNLRLQGTMIVVMQPIK
jgi:hypothetical protein